MQMKLLKKEAIPHPLNILDRKNRKHALHVLISI